MGIRAFATQTAVGTPVPGSMSVYKVSSVSGGQDIWPFATQSDPVGFEGGDAVLRGGGGVFVDLFHNTPRVYQVDIALPCNGPGVTVARSFNGVQVPDSTSPGTIDISGSRRDSDGYQGYNWFQERPELVKSWAGTGAGSSADDRLYLLTGADTALEFKRDGTGTTFVGVNGTQAAIVHTADGGGSPGLYEYRDLSGTVMTFFDFDGDAYGAAGQLWKTRDMDGASGTHTSYIGHASTIATALAAFEQSGGHPTARPTTIYDAAGRRYTYAYSTFGGKTRLSQVKAERYISSAWTEITRVDYDYYTSTSSGKGVAGDLKTSTTTTPLSSGGDDVRATYYRYYTAAYSSPSNPGHPHQLKLVVSAEALRQYGAGYESETDSNLQPYASGYFTYGSDCRLATALFNGECGCSGGGMGGNGTYKLSVEANANFSGSWSDGTYDCSGNWTGAQWALRTTITTPDSHKVAHYFDEAGQSLGTVLSSANDFSGGGNKYWITKYNRDTSGRIVAVYTPAVFSGGGYTHTTGGGTNGGTLTTGSTGLTYHRTYSGDTYLPSAVTQTEHSNGPAATKYGDTKTDYTSASSKGYWDHGTARLARPLPSASKQYVTDEVTVGGASSTDYDETTYAYTYYQVSSVDTWRVKTVTTTLPVVTSGTNGSNSADTTVRYMDELGRTIFTKDELAKYTWTGFDADTGQATTQVNDPNSGTTGASSDASTWSISLPGGGLERTTSFVYDEQGRQVGSILESGRVTAIHYTKLADGRLATVSTPAITTGGSTYYWSPAGYTVTNLAGRQEASGAIAFTS
ncbi:MAG: hypothetical protein ACOYPS_12695, partial [Phycisphaerales bacterium]